MPRLTRREEGALLRWASCGRKQFYACSRRTASEAERIVRAVLMRHQDGQIRVLHDITGRATEYHLPQPVAGKGSFYQQIAA